MRSRELAGGPTCIDCSAEVDSGFVSCGYCENRSMRASCEAENADAELSESLIRNLSLKHASINNLETLRTQRPRPMQQRQSGSIVARANRLNVRWNEVERSESSCALKQSYEFFFKQDCEGDTQLHISIVLNHVEASLWLIDLAPHPCLLDIANDESQTALHLAVMMRAPRLVRRLLLAGADPRLRTLTGNTPLHIACALGDLGCVEALTETLAVCESNWWNAMSTSMSRQILELRNNVGKTCLHIAASKGHLDLVHQLVRSGADVNAREGLGGKTALHLAIENGHRQVVRYFAQEHRTCLDVITYAGATAYQLAVDVDMQLAEDLLRISTSPVCDSRSENKPHVFATHISTFSRMGLVGQNPTAITA